MRLTECQKTILLHVLQGKSNEEIAKDVNRREATVKMHINSLLRIFKAKSRLELVCGIYGHFVDPYTALSAGEFGLKTDREKLEALVERINENG